MASLFVLLQHASLFAALAVLPPIRCGSVLSDLIYRKRGMIVSVLTSSLQGDRLHSTFNRLAKGSYRRIFSTFDLSILWEIRR